jgi:hypothetical protein
MINNLPSQRDAVLERIALKLWATETDLKRDSADLVVLRRNCGETVTDQS